MRHGCAYSLSTAKDVCLSVRPWMWIIAVLHKYAVTRMSRLLWSSRSVLWCWRDVDAVSSVLVCWSVRAAMSFVSESRLRRRCLTERIYVVLRIAVCFDRTIWRYLQNKFMPITFWNWSYCLNAWCFIFFPISNYLKYIFMWLCFAKERKQISGAQPSLQILHPHCPAGLVVDTADLFLCFCASSVCEFTFAMSQFFRTICALEIKMTLLCHWAMHVETRRWCCGAIGLSDAWTLHTSEEFKTLFHPVSLNITSTQYTGQKKLNKTQQPDATLILFFYKKISCRSFTLKRLHLTWICIALAVVTIWFGRLQVKNRTVRNKTKYILLISPVYLQSEVKGIKL